MGIIYSRDKGIRRVDWSCGAKVGDVVKAYSGSYKVVEIDDYGFYVCENLDPNCLASDDIRTFDDLDIDEVMTADCQYGHGEGV